MSRKILSSLELDAAAILQFGATPPATGQVRATGSFLCRSTGAMSLTCDTGNAVMTASTGIASMVAGTSIGIQGQTGVQITANTGNAVMTASTGIASMVAGAAVGIQAATAVSMTGGTGTTITSTTGNTTVQSPAGITGITAGGTINCVAGNTFTASCTNAMGLTGGTGFTATATTGTANLNASAGNVNLTATGASSDVVCTAGRNTSDVAAAKCFLTGGTGIDIKATTGDVLLTAVANNFSAVAAGDCFLTHGAGRIAAIAGSGGAFLRFTNEAAASTPTLSAGQALFWVKDDAPNTPYFTDDTNADRKILTAPAALSDLAQAAANTLIGNPTAAAAAPVVVPIGAHALGARVGSDIVAQPLPTLFGGAGLNYGSGRLAVEYYKADFTVDVPALASGALGYYDVSVASTLIAPLAVGDLIDVTALADVPPFNARVSAANTIRIGFQGAVSAIVGAPFRAYKLATTASPVHPATVASAWLRAALATQDTGVSGASSVLDARNLTSPAVQATAARRPTLGASANGYPILTFDGTRSLQWPVTANTFSTTKLGFGMWVKPAATGGNQQLICLYDQGSGGSVASFLFQLSGTSLVLSAYDPSGSGLFRSATVASVFANGVWAFVGFELDDTGATEADRISLFSNGVKLSPAYAGTGATFTGLRSATGSLSIGTLIPPSNQAFNGSLGPNIYAITSKMAGATQGLLTTAARATLMAFEQPT